MTILAIILIALGSFVTISNIGGYVAASLRAKRGESGGHSNVHFLTLLFCGGAWLILRTPWALLPAILDPANWLLLALPFFLLAQSRKERQSARRDGTPTRGADAPASRDEDALAWAHKTRRQGALECELCKTRTVVCVRESEHGVKLWRCRSCGDQKLWCPRCDQGWIRRLRSLASDRNLLRCDECDATWHEPESVGREPFEDFQTLVATLDEGEAPWQVVRERGTDGTA